MEAEVSIETLSYFFHHVFLPPKLPGGDNRSARQDDHLLRFVQDSLLRCSSLAEEQHQDVFQDLSAMVKSMRQVRNDHGHLDEHALLNALQSMSTTGSPTVLPLEITEQNAGIIIRKAEDQVVFEVFELSPDNASVFKTQGRLVRHFPSTSVAIATNTVQEPGFNQVIANTLAKMSHQAVPGMRPQVRKAQQYHDEERDTTKPCVVTEFLSNVLLAFGTQATETSLCKNTREEVMWNDSRLPWRRSPLWLLVRVALQSTLRRRSHGSDDLYKYFMAFLLSGIMDQACSVSMASEVLHAMSAKLSRRWVKLGHSKSSALAQHINQSMLAASRFVKTRWDTICQQASPPLDLGLLSRLDTKRDIRFHLPKLDKFLRGIPRRTSSPVTSSFTPLSQVPRLSSLSLPTQVLDSKNEEYRPFRLAAFESWVDKNLTTWLEANVHCPSVCHDLRDLTEKYHADAKAYYRNLPEGISRMFLTILELWVAADRVAVTALPLLRDYQHEIPVELYQALLLSRIHDMERLDKAEKYLIERKAFALQKDFPSVFRSFGDAGSFSTRYFSDSHKHQRLLIEIEEYANKERSAKITELERLQNEYRELMRLHSEATCTKKTVYDDWNVPSTSHLSCDRCWYERRAKELTIQIHEWPLPALESQKQATVVELDPPPPLQSWRDLTIYLIDDVLKSYPSHEETLRTRHTLRNYAGLRQWQNMSYNGRLYLFSKTKPHVRTHRDGKYLASLETSDVCVNNGLQLSYFDSERNVFMSKLASSEKTSSSCLIKLPRRSAGLEKFMVRTHSSANGVFPNTVLAYQDEYPAHMKLGECKALASIPCGYKLQWMGILRELTSPLIDFNKPESAIFLAQISLQTGPALSGKPCRASHLDLTDDGMISQLLAALHNRLSRIEENLESTTSLWTFILLAARSMTITNTSKAGLMDFLGCARTTAYRWLLKLVERSSSSQNDEQRNQLQRMLYNTALICSETFNVDHEQLEHILDHPDAVSIFVESSINIRDHSQLADENDSLQSLLFERWRHVMHRASPIMRDQVLLCGNNGLNLAISRHWPGFTSASDWCSSPSADYWIESPSNSIHYNTLTGELLVNGRPLSHLPTTYTSNQMYRDLFGRCLMNVMPSLLPGMDFSSKMAFEGHNVHFGKQPTSGCPEQLLIRIIKADSNYDIVPSDTLAGVLPHAFVRDFVHWYDHSTGSIEFRSINSPWKKSDQNWQLIHGDHGWKLTHCLDDYIVNPSSKIAKHISVVLGALEDPFHQHVIYDAAQRCLDIQLYRLRMDFFARRDSTAIESCQFRGMQVDEQQSIGTLIGLRSKLVLRGSDNQNSRLVLVSEGRVKLRGDFDGLSANMHPQVFVEIGTASRVQPYRIDPKLGRLVDCGTLQSKLFLAHLHATTSHCLPDPLTGTTGTEQALTIMRSAVVTSTVHLNEEESDRLERIAALAPTRQFYPRNEKVMQTVTWSSQLSFYSQHGLLYTVAKDLLANVQRTSFLYPHESPTKLRIEHSDMELVARDLNNTAYLRTDGFGAEVFSTSGDMLYKQRDRTHDSQRTEHTGKMAMRVFEKNQSLQERPINGLATNIYHILSKSSLTSAINEEPKLYEVQYSANWLTKPKSALSKLWHKIHYAFQFNHQWINRFQVAMWLAAQAYASEEFSQVNQVLFGLACLPRVSEVQLPAVGNYNLSGGFEFDENEIKRLVNKAVYPLSECPESHLLSNHSETYWEFQERQNRSYNSNKDKSISAFVENLRNQWPCPEPPPLPPNDYIKSPEAMVAISSIWKTWHKNLLFLRYLEQIEQALSSYDVTPLCFQPVQGPTQSNPSSRQARSISTNDLFRGGETSQALTSCIQLTVSLDNSPQHEICSGKLNDVINHLEQRASSIYEKHYILELQHSLDELQTQSHQYCVAQSGAFLRDLVQRYQLECESHVSRLFDMMMVDTDFSRQALPSHESGETGYDHQGQTDFLPRRSPSFFLSQLQRSRWSRLSESWKRKIVAYGLALVNLQRAGRLLQHCGNESEFTKELRNPGHQDWDPFEYPEWLLMECESGFLIRPVQHQIALQMMAPPDGRNATMQLNMGEGKSSVIAPSIALAFANGSQLLRLIVTKPQFRQMRQILLARLGNLAGRRIYEFPISRDVRLDTSRVEVIRGMIQECIQEGGLMLVQPEHLLSFQLMGIEQMINGQATIARSLLDIQHHFDTHSRDIIDESDEVLSVKFELVYTIGQQRPIEHSPQRWTVIQQVLEFVRQLAVDMQSEFPKSMDVYDWRHESWRYPRIRIFRKDALSTLVERLSEKICQEGLDGFPISRQPKKTRLAVQKYISMHDIPLDDVECVEKGAFWTDAVVSTLLLLRGLIAGGVISHALCQKRWRVNYGVDVNRVPKTRLAVPFRAKDDPAPRSEFSHPDVVIVLTSLSYYYSGLEDQDLFDSFHMLRVNDQSTSEYAIWVQYASPDLPHAFRDLAGINLQDRAQCVSEIFPHLRYSKGVIDYFMSRIIFSKEMKEFPHKLSASGWDLCRVKTHPVTGFSGTNDSRCILPASIKQLDLPQQRHTNALVLEYLVRPETKVFLMPKGTSSNGPSSDGAQLLQQFMQLQPQVRVILDVGAQIIDLTNVQVAQQWLDMVEEDGEQTQAVIFFNDQDVLSVVDRSGCIEPLQISPFAKQTEKCLAFLDESHTRGTDLKLPQDYRAAVTLGQNITKDRLVQACMRMRMLGQGQSVVFCVPDEIRNKIMQEHALPVDGNIDVTHILTWAISETFLDTKKAAPLWATQATRFYNQDRVRKERIEAKGNYSELWAGRFLEDEAHSLERRYRPGVASSSIADLCKGLSDAIFGQINNHLEQFGPLDTEMASLQEQQERELSPEAEEERQVERPTRAEPLSHRVHPNVLQFVRHGFVATNKSGFNKAFKTLGDTSIAAHANINELPRDLLVTDDFARTIKVRSRFPSDLFQRPVQWILATGRQNESPAHLVVISQYEAHELLEDIKRSKFVSLHLYNPRMDLNNPSLDHLMLYTVPRRENINSVAPSLVHQLNLFAGQLYLQSFEEYTQVCQLLCLACETADSDIPLGADGFIPPGQTAGICTNDGHYMRSPTKFIHELMARIRRNSEGVEKTHMGKLLAGKLLKRDDFTDDSSE
ncbi:hypothetical protein PFICI_00496 [Pestalotiopsis fici W106-1]|uniref:ubiquitinyl hydrolase 1 n=1 Tax=Pestalotiopsis fici (strain W106-1 / CGMCC3.15140) TaxID=1229662 RepID=W3XKT3_PESFW|nr:uncharacterized protein PFICI_00496 [Pestalotiopsis fici W106-1]ETS86668.1 hypothetical protein PFICI_00496 [Pestalotiopsis fici W106-1]